ncbi:endonuclease/exonuclease/phosphatase family [Holotrichia oblita]|uniref:Endonuclease/exonuclease/phosphatase family n=1 Tax=Holotrichia oblita TaxID=644536 RepID=A0ACB9SL13_HOLOL|nr:endonuclease/exonuclease/phosphatase family [Holotrichia oblita]
MSHNITLAHLNIRSLLPSFNDVAEVVLDNNYSILCISETWLRDGIDAAALGIDNYSFVHRDRPSRGGGVAMYIKNDLKFTVLQMSYNIEQLWALISVGQFKFAVGVAYRPQQCDRYFFINELENSLSEVLPQSSLLILVGDFNIHMNLYHSSHTRALTDAMAVYGLTQIVEENTRVTATSASLVDVIFVTDRDILADSGVRDFHLSDHALTFCTLKFTCNKQQPQMRRHMPLTQFRSNRAPAPWLTETIRVMQKHHDNALKTFKKSSNPIHWDY